MVCWLSGRWEMTGFFSAHLEALVALFRVISPRVKGVRMNHQVAACQPCSGRHYCPRLLVFFLFFFRSSKEKKEKILKRGKYVLLAKNGLDITQKNIMKKRTA